VKSFRERNLLVVGGVAVAVVAALIVGAWQFNSILALLTSNTYQAYFEEAGGLTTGAPVRVTGYQAGQVQSIDLDSTGVVVTFTVDDDIRLGQDTKAKINTISLLGNKVLDLSPRGSGHLHAPIPLDRTTSAYQLPDALGDLTATISGLNTSQLSTALQTLSQSLRDTPPQLKVAVDGVSRFSQTLSDRDAQLRTLLANARKATTILANRTDEVVGLIHDTNAVLAALRTQSSALDHISGNISELAHQIHGFIGDNQAALKPALEKLNGVLAIVDNRKVEIQQSIRGLNSYAMSLGEALSSGPFFKAYVSNLLPGQFVQPFVDAAFSDLGLDPNVLLPSQRTDPQTGQPGTPNLPIPYPRTGQGGEPKRTLPDAITGKPGDPRYPYREPLPGPPPGGPPPGPPALLPGQQGPIQPTKTPVFVPAPGEPNPASPQQPTGAGQ
jgi:phospholipid/cholesterol/gamma-HCH transport system substrate-binding protein